uniref:O-phosphoserine phosphohydrolase n=1 Tax=Leersia perrieri TaxID=77586 RepID=A0A0D9XZL1_9ORYZ
MWGTILMGPRVSHPTSGPSDQHEGLPLSAVRFRPLANEANYYPHSAAAAAGLRPRASSSNRRSMAQMGSQCIGRQQSFSVPRLSSTRPGLHYRLAIGHVNMSFRGVKHSNRLSFEAAALEVPKSMPSANSESSLTLKEAMMAWSSADAVCFDVDSTVCLDEGIDELADFCGAGQAVAEWTAKAMTGSVTFEEALAARLSLFKPSLGQVEDCMEKRPPRISPGIAELVKKLKAKNVDVYLVSGGFRQMIKPVAMQLGIPPENVFANQLLFGASGEYVGFDPAEPTSRSGGKAVAVQHIRQKCGYKTLIMIGDGATDLEARQHNGADLFICYAGVQMREAVAAKADWVVFDFDELMAYLV